MEYLVLAGGDLKESLTQKLGEFAPVFWGVLAPLALGLLWLGAAHALWNTWARRESEEQGQGGLPARLFVSLFLVGVILGSGTGLEFLLLGGGYVHARLLSGVLSLAQIH